MTTPGGRWIEVRFPDGRMRQDWVPAEQPASPDGGQGTWHVVRDANGQTRWEWHPGHTLAATPPAFGTPAGFGAPPGFGPPTGGGFRPAAPKKSNKKAWIIAGVVVGVLVIVGGISSALDDKPSETAAQAKDDPASTPTTTTNEFGVEGAVSGGKALGELEITFPIGDNLTAGLIRNSAARDVFAILNAVRDRSFKTVRIVGTYPIKDKFGDAQTTEVMWLTFKKATVLRIDPSKLDRGSLSVLESLSCNFGMSPFMGYELHNTEDGPCYSKG